LKQSPRSVATVLIANSRFDLAAMMRAHSRSAAQQCKLKVLPRSITVVASALRLSPSSNFWLTLGELRQHASVGFLVLYFHSFRITICALASLIFDRCGREKKKEDLINW